MSAKTMSPLPFTPAHTRSLLGASLHIKGEISGAEDLQVDGCIDGLIQLEGRKLTAGATAKVVADVIAGEIIVYGDIKGNLCARERIEIRKDGSVVGELATSRIMIEDGAYFKGAIEVDHHIEPALHKEAKAGGSAHTSEKEPASLLGGAPTLHLPSHSE